MSIFQSFAKVDLTDVWPQTSFALIDVIIQLFSVYNTSECLFVSSFY